MVSESLRNLLLQIFQVFDSAVVELLHLVIHMIDEDPVLEVTLPHVVLYTCLLFLDILNGNPQDPLLFL